MKNAISRGLAVGFSNAAVADVKLPDLNRRLRARVQTSYQAMIDARLQELLANQQTNPPQLNKQRHAVGNYLGVRSRSP